MHIHLNDSDVAQMLESLGTSFLDWLPKHLDTQLSNQATWQQSSKLEAHTTQLNLDFNSQTLQETADNRHVRLTQIFDAGITKRGMAVRVKLKRELATKRGCEYVNSLEISATGTIVYENQEFDKPSPLAAKVNSGGTNGWEYVEVKRNNQWVCLDELRQIWRKTNV